MHMIESWNLLQISVISVSDATIANNFMESMAKKYVILSKELDLKL